MTPPPNNHPVPHLPRAITAILLCLAFAGCGPVEHPQDSPSPSAPSTPTSVSSTPQPEQVVEFFREDGRPWGRVRIPGTWSSRQVTNSPGTIAIDPKPAGESSGTPYYGTASRSHYDYDTFEESKHAAVTSEDDDASNDGKEEADLTTEGGKLYSYWVTDGGPGPAHIIWLHYGTVIDQQGYEIKWYIDTTMIDRDQALAAVEPVMKTFVPLPK